MALRKSGPQVHEGSTGQSTVCIDARAASGQVVVNMEEIRGNTQRLTVCKNSDAAMWQRRNGLTGKTAFIMRYERPGCEDD